MRNLTLKLASALFVVALVSACSSTKTASTGSQDSTNGSGVSTSGIESGGKGRGTDTSGKLLSHGNIIYFDYDSDVIRPDGREVLMSQAARLKSGGRATLEGHCDERGSREYNIALGERRAKAVRDFLVVQGVSSSQLEVVSYGEERPVDAASNESAWMKNRRVEIK